MLEAAKTGGFIIMEDDFLGDLDYLGEKTERLAALSAGLSRRARDTHPYFFEGAFFPRSGLRKPRAILNSSRRCSRRKFRTISVHPRSCSVGSRASSPTAATTRDLVRVRPRYRAAREALRTALSDRLLIGSELRFDDPPAGMCLLGHLPRDVELRRFASECAKDGVSIGEGTEYWLDGMTVHNAGCDSFRIGFGSLSPEEILRAAAVFRNAVQRAKENAVE